MTLSDTVLNGVHIGEHGFDPDKVIDEIYERCVQTGLNFVTIRPGYKSRRPYIPQHYFLEWAEYLAAHKIYFIFLYTVQHAPDGRQSHLDPETVAKIRQIAGEYYLGDMIGEVGSSMACKMPGYFSGSPRKDNTVIRTDYPDMKAAHEGYVESAKKYIAVDRALGHPDILSIEATILHKYNTEAGVTIPMLEMMCGQPELQIAALRGAARASDAKMWGTYIAHEWYGGMRHDDTLKRKRLELAYKYAYMAGTNCLCLESGDVQIESYGQEHGRDSTLCRDYQNVLTSTMELIRSDDRPLGGPKTKVAFVSGLHDAWGGWGGSSVWNQFYRPEWGYGEAEYSWRLLDEIGTKRSWSDVANFGTQDLSPYPAYGMYDIVPIEADEAHLAQYDYLIFLGWNSMTDENMEKLTRYVQQGGNLLMSAAHLNTNTKRDGAFSLPANEKLEALFGCRFTGEVIPSNDGVKFCNVAANEAIVYPGCPELHSDPVYSAGYVNWAKMTLCGGTEAAVLGDSFAGKSGGLCAAVQNKLGNGTATLVTAMNYPGHGALMPLYRAMVRAFLTASVKQSSIRVLGSDRLRWAVYGADKIYLLNTDYDMPITVKVIKENREQTVTLNSLELKWLEV